ncbi:MAG TPA: TIGR01777 family oxidoreductase [Candidatus Acidoferrales bacterium]|nr:TIGR01777 family oxidoreductase [Candidatus Acidoferrales bacterium]
MRVLLTGASGLIGARLVAALHARGDQPVRLVRRVAAAPDEIAWDPANGRLDPATLAGADAVVNLAGESLGARRWTPARRLALRESRLRATRTLVRALAAARPAPRVLVSASGVGIYGDRGDEWLDERSSAGAGFLAAMAGEWERAAIEAEAAGTRVVRARIGLVLAREGGALGAQLPLFRAGLGGPLGSGRQWWSWISIDDLVATLLHAMDRDDVSGVLNAVAPAPVRQAEFARALGRALGRPAWLPAPAFALRLALGRGVADELLLSGQRVRPGALLGSGFGFGDPELGAALARLLAGRAGPK